MSVAFHEHLSKRLDQCGVPATLHDGLRHYIADRRPVGSFLTAILSNDLAGAVVRADPENRFALPEIVLFLHGYAPSKCWGSPAAVTAWLLDPSPVPEIFE
jgi:hypothetical protein